MINLEAFKYLILGIVQGFTEPLPISSSGHVAIAQEVLNINNPGISFEAFINFGSTIAILIYFRHDIITLFYGGLKYLRGGLKTNTTESSYLWKIFFSTLPLVFGALLIQMLGITIGDNLTVIGYALIVTAFSLFFVYNKDGKTDIKSATIMMVIFIGVGQTIALMPGISRSGMTMVFALLIGIEKKEAFKFSFLMFIPASIGALIYSIIIMISEHSFNPLFIISAFMAFIFTLIGLKITENFVTHNNLHYFGIYCLIIGLTVILFIT